MKNQLQHQYIMVQQIRYNLYQTQLRCVKQKSLTHAMASLPMVTFAVPRLWCFVDVIGMHLLQRHRLFLEFHCVKSIEYQENKMV